MTTCCAFWESFWYWCPNIPQTDQGFRISHWLGKVQLKTKLLFVPSNTKHDYEPLSSPRERVPPRKHVRSGRQADTYACKTKQHSFHFRKLLPWHHFQADKAFQITHLLQNALKVTNCFLIICQQEDKCCCCTLSMLDGWWPKSK